MEKNVRIRFQDLPHRARSLSPTETSKVFGGCGGKGAPCSQANQKDQCCSHTCESHWVNYQNPDLTKPGSYSGQDVWECT